MECRDHAFYLWVVFHELLGHGTGKLLTEDKLTGFNFDIDNPPVSPLTGEPINSWYRPGETWTGVFGDIATSVDECRAECVGAFLMSDMELLDMFGYNDESTITCGDRKSEFDDIRVKLDNVSQLNTTCTCSSVLLDFVL